METSQPLEQESSDADDEENSKTYRDGVIDTVNVVSLCGVVYAVYQIWVVIPKFVDLFKALRVDLPLPTRLVLAVSHQLPLLPIFVGVYILLIVLIRRTRSRRLAIAVMFVAMATGPIAYESIM
jgi:hypothetical protein